MGIYRASIHIVDGLQIIDQAYSFNPHVEGVNSTDQAWAHANEIAEALAGTVLPVTCFVESVSVSNPNLVNGHQSRRVSIPGTRVATGSALPAWNVVRLQMSAFAGGRPSTFYLRMGLTEGDVAGQLLEATTQAAVQSFLDAMEAIPRITTPAGDFMDVFTFDTRVRLRQMDAHRRSRPGFHRGWVPD